MDYSKYFKLFLNIYVLFFTKQSKKSNMNFSKTELEKIANLPLTIQNLIKVIIQFLEKIIIGEFNFITSAIFVENLSIILSPDVLLSKYQVAKELKVSARQIDRYVMTGLLAKPIKRQGFKEVGWRRKDVEKCKCLLKSKLNN